MFFHYVLGTLFARKIANGVVVLSMGLVIGACVVSLGFYRGLKDTLTVTGRADNLVVMRGGVLQASKSFLPKQVVDMLGVLPLVAREDGGPLISPEAHLEMKMSMSQ